MGVTFEKVTFLALGKKLALLSVVLAFLFGFFSLHARADNILDRSIEISSAVPEEGNVDYTINFRPVTASPIGSVVFEFCDNSPLPNVSCSLTNGLDITSASLTTQTGNTGFVVGASASPASQVLITRAAAPINLVDSSYTFANMLNPATPNSTTYVRIFLYASTDGTGTPVDEGSVAFSTAENFSVGAYVPPFLTFCVGETVAVDCSSTAGDLLEFGELSQSTARSATSQFSAATNDPEGYNIFSNGSTMTSGNNIINPLVDRSASSPGQSQFGLNLRQNSSPRVGANPQGSSSGEPTSDYNQTNRFKFENGAVIARSPNSTAYTRYTVSYIVNISEDQAPGSYSTSLIYTAIASF